MKNAINLAVRLYSYLATLAYIAWLSVVIVQQLLYIAFHTFFTVKYTTYQQKIFYHLIIDWKKTLTFYSILIIF